MIAPSEKEIRKRLAEQPPFVLEAEMGVIGSVLLLPECFDSLHGLDAGEFYDDANRFIFRHLQNMCDDGEPIDVTLLAVSYTHLTLPTKA